MSASAVIDWAKLCREDTGECIEKGERMSNIPVGTKIICTAHVRNYHPTDSGDLCFLAWSIVEDKKLCGSSPMYTAPGETHTHSCEFVMPGRDVNVELLACHYPCGKEDYDTYYRTFYLSPETYAEESDILMCFSKCVAPRLTKHIPFPRIDYLMKGAILNCLFPRATCFVSCMIWERIWD